MKLVYRNKEWREVIIPEVIDNIHLPNLEGVKMQSTVLPLGFAYMAKTMFVNEGVLLVTGITVVVFIIGFIERTLAESGNERMAHRLHMALVLGLPTFVIIYMVKLFSAINSMFLF